MVQFVVAHGAWSAGWAWKKMHPILRAAGHGFTTPTYTGLGERAHLIGPNVDLDTHIRDVVAVLEMEDLADVVLIGHSYGGMVATGVADRARERIAALVYLDAFAPQDGESVVDMLPENHVARMREAAATAGDGWRIPPGPMPPDTPADDVAWAMPRRMPQPLAALTQKLALTRGPLTLPTSYIHCRRIGPGDPFRPSYERAQREGWTTFEIDASHNPHITVPLELAAILGTIAARGR